MTSDEVKARLSDFAYRVKNAISEAIFPSDFTCDFCGNELNSTTGRLRLCADCISRLPEIHDRFCLNCGAPMTGEGDYCDRCRNREFKFEIARAPLVYEGYARQMILSMKLEGKRYLAHDLAAMMSDKFIECKMEGEIVTFAPMTAAEEKKRGFNQAELLAYEVGQRLMLPVLPAIVKVKETGVQKQLSENERQKNLQGAFQCVFNQIKGRKILFVDDVFTTGATAEECTAALIKAGARQVQVLTAAITKKQE